MKTRSIIPKNAVLAEIEHNGHRVTAICEMGRTMNRTLRLRPLFVEVAHFDELAQVLRATMSNMELMSMERQVMETQPVSSEPAPLQITQSDAACIECGLHQAAIAEIGCPRSLDIPAPPNCLVRSGA